MLSRSVLKNIARVKPTPFLGIRFNATIAANQGENVSVKPPSSKTTHTTNKPSSTKATNGIFKSQARNVKHKEIVNQISETIESGSIGESLEILEEGISFLREIEKNERLSPILVYSDFVKLSSDLLIKLLNNHQDIEPLINILMKYDISNHYHFYLLMKHELTLNTPNKYENILKYWVQYLEISGARNHLKIFDDENINYRFKKITDLVYFAYCQGVLNGNYEYNPQDILSLLKFDEEPFIYKVRYTLNELPIANAEIVPFLNMFKFIKNENLNPNSSLTFRKLDEFHHMRDEKKIWEFFEELKKSSIANNYKIDNLTIFKFMSSFYELEKFDYVLKIFQDLLNQGDGSKVEKSIWELVIKTIGHTNYVTKFDNNGKSEISKNLQSIINTMIKTLPDFKMDARMLSNIVGSFANLNDFDKVDEYLTIYKKIPLVQIGKNKILLGLNLNNKIEQSEKKLQQYIAEDKSFKPSIKVINSYLNYYCKQENFEAINGLIEFMKNNKISEDIATLTILIDNYSKLNFKQGKKIDFNEISKILNNSNLKLNDKTYSVLLESIIRDGNNIKLARELFNNLLNTEYQKKNKKISNELLISMLNGELLNGSINEAEKIFKIYIKTSGSNVRLWNMMISNLLKFNENLALNYYEMLKNDKKLSPNMFTYYFMISNFSKRENFKVLQQLVNDLSNSGLTDLGNQLPKLLLSMDSKIKLPDNLRNIIQS